MLEQPRGHFPEFLWYFGILGGFWVPFGKRGPFNSFWSFQKSPFPRDSREFRDSREPQTVENKGESDNFSRDFREVRDFRDSRDSSSEKTPFI